MNVEMRGICKAFGANVVLRNVSFSLRGGEICALIGENGAGKSTLMNILGGVLLTDSGEVLLDEQPTVLHTPAESLGAGIAFIHQELNLINDLAVYENMFIGRELKQKNGLLDANAMCREAQGVFDRMGLHLDPKAMVRDLDASYKQIVEISRALMMNASIIIMDEPTTSLTGPEIDRVFDMMRILRTQGVGIVFISHKLKEVMQICDRYTVLRDGKMVAEGSVADATTDDLARFMVGHDIRTMALQREKKLADEVFRAEKLSDRSSFHNISFSVRGGEILGITGLLGDGRTELFLSIIGAGTNYTGQVYFEGQPVKLRSTTQALDVGVGYLPRNRKENGIIKDMDILENASVVSWPRISKFGFINRVLENTQLDAQIKNLHIKLEKKTDSINSLSGGNQQKVVLAKWLSIHPRLLILDNPTQGVDVGAKEDIYDIILNLADKGVRIVVLSSEAQEIIRVCDRALVMYHGALQGELTGAAMNEHDIMRLATGASLN